MRKLSLVFLACFSPLIALPVGNPADPMLFTNHLYFDKGCEVSCLGSWTDWFSLRLGYSGNFVSNRKLKLGQDKGTLPDVEYQTNSGLIVLNICEWVDLFATIGTTHFSAAVLDTPLPSLGGASIVLHSNYSTEVSYSAGGRISVWRCGNFTVGVEGEYFYTLTELDSISSDNTGTITYYNSTQDRSANYAEWQVALAATYHIVDSACFSILPYAAITFSGVDWQTERTLAFVPLTLDLPDIEQQQTTGWALGVTGLLLDRISATVEGRFANETALSVSGQVSF